VSGGNLKQIATEILARLPDHGTELADALHKPTSKTLRTIASDLLAAGHVDAVEALYRALADQQGIGAWPVVGLAEVVSKRGRPEQVVAAWTDCLRRYPEHAKPYWFLEIARAERARKKPQAELSYLRQGSERFPRHVPLLLAQARASFALGLNEESIETTRNLIHNFSSEAKPGWFVILVSALRAAGRFDDEEKAIDELGARFPDDPTALACRAQRAVRLQAWSDACDLWTRCLEGKLEPAKPDWLNGRATALFRIWRVEEALEAWSDLVRDFPDFVPAYVAMAGANQELGRWQRAYDIWNSLIRARPDQSTRHWYVQRATCTLNRSLSNFTNAAIAELEAKFPESALGRRLAIDFAVRRDEGVSAYSSLLDDAITRYPTDSVLLSHRVNYLLAAGQSCEAERTITNLVECPDDDVPAMLCRWRVLLASNDEASVKKTAQRVVAGRLWPLAAGISICRCLHQIASLWAIELALQLSDDLHRRFPNSVECHCVRSRLLIALHRYDEALAVIANVPLLFQGEEIAELRAWGAKQRGDIEGARKSWSTILCNYHYSALHGPEPHLELLTAPRAFVRNTVTLFTPVHNELTNLPHFFRHYRRIGVRQFVMVDNLSSDGSSEYLREQPDVILYRTEDNFSASCSGMRWMNVLMDRHGGEWCLYADADEEFIYPGCETVSVDRLTDYLEAQDAEGMTGFMLDVYPERLFDRAGRPAARTDCRYYDSDYRWTGHSTCPYFKLEGGARSRLFGTKELLHKVPLIKRSAGAYILSHETTPLKLANVTAVLLHYSMTDLPSRLARMKSAGAAANPASDRKPAVKRRYEQYAAQLNSMVGRDLRVPGVSQQLNGSLDLVDHGLMNAPPDFQRWLTEQHRDEDLREYAAHRGYRRAAA